MIAYAQAQLGKPHLWGGSGPDTFDCSGHTMRAYQQIDIALPHNSAAQAVSIRPIPFDRIQAVRRLVQPQELP